jgi:hypothetical protein
LPGFSKRVSDSAIFSFYGLLARNNKHLIRIQDVECLIPEFLSKKAKTEKVMLTPGTRIPHHGTGNLFFDLARGLRICVALARLLFRC